MSSIHRSGRRLSIYVAAMLLFTWSDFKTTAVPSTTFAIVCRLKINVDEDLFESTSLSNLLRDAFFTAFWVWLNLLVFTIENQRGPTSIKEDRENKPWRPLPRKLITPSNAATLVRYAYLAVLIASFILGGLLQSLALMILGFAYSRLGGGDGNFILRNLLNSSGYMCFLSGATEVMQQSAAAPSKVIRWILLIGTVILTTIHIQDLPDQVGNRAKNRQTLPIVIGDGPCRWTVAAFVAAWSLLCPLFWEVSNIGLAMLVILGGVIGGRVLVLRTMEADQVTWQLFNLWVIAVYILPLFGNIEKVEFRTGRI